jgi:serine protease Do
MEKEKYAIPAEYVGGSMLYDIAVLKVRANDILRKSNAIEATFADSDDVTILETAIAIGNPEASGISATVGHINVDSEYVTMTLADDSTLADMRLMRIDTAVNGGNSGGGLFNERGEVIGIVNAKIVSSTIDNIGYAIPSTTVVKCINDLKDHGYITGRARLGVTVNTKQYQVSWIQTLTVIQVAEISENGSAAKSGLQVGDILIRFEGKDMTSFEILSQQLTKYSVGDTVKLTVLRPTIELTGNNLTQYINTAKEVEIEITFVEFNPNM